MFYLLCMAYMMPTVLFVALFTRAVWVVPPGLAVFVGGPAVIAWYLMQPEVKRSMGARDQNYSRTKFAGVITLATAGSLLLFGWMAWMTLQAIGRGLR
jgi:hypothetical protein